jgi:hypothetical protein
LSSRAKEAWKEKKAAGKAICEICELPVVHVHRISFMQERRTERDTISTFEVLLSNRHGNAGTTDEACVRPIVFPALRAFEIYFKSPFI